MGARENSLGLALIGRDYNSGYGNAKSEIDRCLAVIMDREERHNNIEIVREDEFAERIGRGRIDMIGEDDLEFSDDINDDDAGYIGAADIIGALQRAAMGKALSQDQRKALRVAHRAAKKAQRRDNEEDKALFNGLRAANRPVVRNDQEDVMRVLNLPMGTITIGAGATVSFSLVVQESIRAERMFLYPVGGSYDNLWCGDLFCGRQTNSVIPGNEEPMIVYSPTSVNSSIEGFTANFGLTVKLPIRNGTGAPVVVGGKIKGRTLTS